MVRIGVLLSGAGMIAGLSTVAMAGDCRNAKPGAACEITIDRASLTSGRKVTVENETSVTVVVVNKSPFESCKNEIKREELPDVSAIPTLLGLFKDLSGALLLPFGAPDAVKEDTPEHVLALLGATLASVTPKVEAAERLRVQYEAFSVDLKAFYATSYRLHPPPGSAIKGPVAFERERAGLAQRATDLYAMAIPAVEAADTNKYDLSIKEYATVAKTATPAVLLLIDRELNRTRGAMDALSKATSVLTEAKATLKGTMEYLAKLKTPEFEARLPITPDRNARLSLSLTCASDVTGKPSMDQPVVYTIVFQNTPRLSLSAGILLSQLPRNSVGLESVKDSAEGVSPITIHSEIREHPHAPQTIPFSFVNIRLWDPQRWRGRILTYNLSPGLGVNPNNGGTAAEFFVGFSVGLGNTFFSIGGHVGHRLEPTNGFAVGDRPPSDLKTVPTDTPWDAGLGVAVSYRIPLK